MFPPVQRIGFRRHANRSSTCGPWQRGTPTTCSTSAFNVMDRPSADVLAGCGAQGVTGLAPGEGALDGS